MPVVSTGASLPFITAFSFEDPILHPYRRRSEKRLIHILEQLELGAQANLGYTKVTWLPDDLVRIRYVRMEGVLQPIILVRVEFQDAAKAAANSEAVAELLEEIEDDIGPPDDRPLPYVPFMWVGIAAFGHSLIGGTDNPNCDFWGYPIDPHLVGFDPPSPLGIGAPPRDFRDSCETLPGTIYQGGAGWAARVGNNASEQRLIRVNGGQTWVMNQFGIDNGTFQDSDWDLSTQGLVQSTHSGMTALEHLDTQVTLPPSAELDLPAGYWKRSIIVSGSGIGFPIGTATYVNALGGGAEALMSATYSGGVIPGSIQSGKYEISAFAQSFQCECTQASLHIRVVLGHFTGAVTITDFFPQGIGTGPTNNRMLYKRDLSLGGNPPCGFGTDEENVFGPNDGGVGWWEQAIHVDVRNGNFLQQDAANRDEPFFGFNCGATPKIGPEDPRCAGCVGDPIVQPANSLDYPRGIHWLTFDAPGGPRVFDGRGGVLWHMARVTQVDAGTGHVCFVRLVGNDGAEGGSCGPCQAFSYGHTMRAIGIDPAIPLNTNLTEACGPDLCKVPYAVGQLVTVIGWTNPLSTPCGVLPADWNLIVTTPHGAGQDFTSFFWQQLRCPGAAPVDSFFEGVQFAFRHRSGCNGGPMPVTCGCVGQMRCVE